MGLLDKATGSQTAFDLELEEFFNKLDAFESGIDFSILLFRNFTDYFDVRKAALFLLSENMSSFDCLLTKGYDKTTSNRLRLDENSNDSDEFIYFRMNKKPYCSRQIPLFLKDFMSTREYGLLDELYWLPFFAENNLIALIMISQWDNIVPATWPVIFEKICKRYSSTIFNGRKSLLKSSETSIPRVNKSDLAEFLDKHRGRNFIIIKINLNPLIALLSESDGLNHVNVKRDILSVFRTMTGSEHEIFELHNNQLLLFLDKDRTPDKDLFMHQISASLPLLFQDLKSTPVIEYDFFENPFDEESRDAIIRDFI